VTHPANAFPLEVCHFANSISRAGAEEYMLGVLRHLDRQRFRPSLACPSTLIDLLRPGIPPDVGVFPVDIARPTQFRELRRFSHFLRDRRVQIVHSHQFRASLVASPTASLCGVPVTVETPHIREYWRKGWKANYTVDRIAGHFVTGYIAVSEANKRYLVAEKRLSERKISVIPCGADLRPFTRQQSAGQALRRELGLSPSQPVLLVAGRLEPQKGHRFLLDALPSICAEFPGLLLFCVGEGSLMSELQHHARDLGIADAVRFAGYQRDMPRWYALADIVVLPSLFEGLPITAIEALASEKPMVATAVDGTPEIVVDGITGLTVPPRDSVALALAIARLLRDPELRATLACQGRELVERSFSIERMVEQIENLYLRLWQARTGTPVPLTGAQQQQRMAESI